MTKKLYVNAEELQRLSINLARQVLESNFFYRDEGSALKNYIIGIWRGGSPVGIYVEEFLRYGGIRCYHAPIKTEAYTGIEKRGPVREVLGLESIVEKIYERRLVRFSSGIKSVANEVERVLIVDDVWDTGLSVIEVLKRFETGFKLKIESSATLLRELGISDKFNYLPTMRIATVFFKPRKNLTNRKPDYYEVETEAWINFPHELEGLTEEEIAKFKPKFYSSK